MGKVLIVIDMQNDFVTGTLGNKEAQAIVLNVQAKVKEYADRGDRIIFTLSLIHISGRSWSEQGTFIIRTFERTV